MVRPVAKSAGHAPLKGSDKMLGSSMRSTRSDRPLFQRGRSPSKPVLRTDSFSPPSLSSRRIAEKPEILPDAAHSPAHTRGSPSRPFSPLELEGESNRPQTRKGVVPRTPPLPADTPPYHLTSYEAAPTYSRGANGRISPARHATTPLSKSAEYRPMLKRPVSKRISDGSNTSSSHSHGNGNSRSLRNFAALNILGRPMPRQGEPVDAAVWDHDAVRNRETLQRRQSAGDWQEGPAMYAGSGRSHSGPMGSEDGRDRVLGGTHDFDGQPGHDELFELSTQLARLKSSIDVLKKNDEVRALKSEIRMLRSTNNNNSNNVSWLPQPPQPLPSGHPHRSAFAPVVQGTPIYFTPNPNTQSVQRGMGQTPEILSVEQAPLGAAWFNSIPEPKLHSPVQIMVQRY
ncbi:hypothetical protein DIPPA_23037 [Diplonema papillatum]|nr:hypothetical protein DIPPA_23037 [Diplonema papillatum]